jgi:carbon storage regulator
MLVLSRQRDETIMIGDSVELTIVDIRGDKVRIGITAPSSVAVHRKEVYESIRQENERASEFRGQLAMLKAGVTPAPGQGGMVPPHAARLAARTGSGRITA